MTEQEVPERPDWWTGDWPLTEEQLDALPRYISEAIRRRRLPVEPWRQDMYDQGWS